MRLPKRSQYALTFTIYLLRTGKARIEDAARTLNIPRQFLEQIARDLRTAGVLQVKRGPGGGYSIAEGKVVLLRDVLAAVETAGLYTETDYGDNKKAGVCGYDSNSILVRLAESITPLLDTPIVLLVTPVADSTLTEATQ